MVNNFSPEKLSSESTNQQKLHLQCAAKKMLRRSTGSSHYKSKPFFRDETPVLCFPYSKLAGISNTILRNIVCQPSVWGLPLKFNHYFLYLHLSDIRAFLAWALLLLFTIQQVAGRMYVSIALTYESEGTMSTAEAALAEKLSQETGIESAIAIHEATALNHLFSLGYGTPFIAFESDGGDTTFYTLKKDLIETGTWMHTTRMPAAGDHPLHPVSAIEKWFPDFCFESSFYDPHFPKNACIIPSPMRNMKTADSHSMLTPPPEFV